MELWTSLSIFGYNNYSVSTLGRICNDKRNKILQCTKQSTGYVAVQLKYVDVNDNYHSHYVHRLVLLAFTGTPSDPRMTCDHINQNKSDNRISNLRWALPEEQGANITETENSKNSKNSLQYKPLAQYDLNGNLIKIWPSRKEAAANYNLDSRRISEACINGNIYSEFYWRNVEDNTRYEDEIWLPVRDPNFNGFFVSSYGRVRTRAGKITFGAESNGYKMVKTTINSKVTTRKVHCLVMEAFHGFSDLIVNHKDGNKSNNNLSNLEYVTYSENSLHAHRTGIHRGKHKPVIQFALDDRPIAIYKGIKIAQMRNGLISLSSTLCGITKTCAGYKWKYLDQIYPKDSKEYQAIMQQFIEKEIIIIGS